MTIRRDTARCEGAKTTAPEAALCRTCARAKAGGDPYQQVFVEVMARMVMSVHGSRPHCEYHLAAADSEGGEHD